MSDVFRKLLHIYPGEEKSAVLFAILGLLWSVAVTSGLKFADALFLLHVGAEHLTIAYMFTAMGMIFLATLLIYAFNSIQIYKIFLTAIGIGILFYCSAFYCLQQGIGIDNKILWYALRIFGSLFFSVSITCYWTFIDQYYTMQDAKRLFSTFCAMVFLGVATTGLIMRSGWIDIQQLTLLICGLLLATASWILYIVRTVDAVHEEKETIDSPLHSLSQLRSLMGQIFRSRFTLLLMCGNFLTFLLLVITEFNYMLSFDQYFDPGVTNATGNEQNARLTQFLGQCLAVVSVSNFIFGLFFYSRLVRKFGIGVMLFITPCILFFNFLGWSFFEGLLFPVIGLFVVEGTLYVVDDSNFNLLLNAVPNKLKYKIRLMIESFFEPIGMLISSLLLSLNLIDSRVLGLVISGIALIVAFLIKRNYLFAVYSNLKENAIHFHRSIFDWFKNMSQRELSRNKLHILAMLKHGDQIQKKMAMSGIEQLQDTALLNMAKIVYKEELPLTPSPHNGESLDRLISKLSKPIDPEERLDLLQQLSAVNDASIAYPLILASKNFRPAERRMAERILLSLDKSVITTLPRIISDRALDDRCRMLAGKVLGRLDVGLLRGMLNEILLQETERAFFYHYHAHTAISLAASLEKDNRILLHDTLMTRYRSSLDFIIQLLGAAGELEDCELLSHCLRSKNAKVHGQVLEALERTSEPQVFAVIYPLICESPMEFKLQAFLKKQSPLTLTQLLDYLCHSASELDRIVGCTLKFSLKTQDWRESLKPHLNSSDELVKHLAQELLESA